MIRPINEFVYLRKENPHAWKTAGLVRLIMVMGSAHHKR